MSLDRARVNGQTVVFHGVTSTGRHGVDEVVGGDAPIRTADTMMHVSERGRVGTGDWTTRIAPELHFTKR